MREAMAASPLSERKLSAARQAFDELSGGQRYALVKEVADERRADYVRLITNVVDVVPGMRRRRDETGMEHICYEPCVVFLVRRKWKASRSDDRHAVPEEILRYIGPDGDRRLCAIPTDVQQERRLLNVRAQARNAVLANDAAAGCLEYGAIAFAVADDAGELYAVSAMHVLSPSRQVAGSGIHDRALESVVVGLEGSAPGPAVLKSTLFGGRLVAGPDLSMDVQLAKVLDRRGLHDVLKGIQLSADRPFVESDADLVGLLEDGRRILVLVPENHPRHLGQSRSIPRATHSTGEALFHIAFSFAGVGVEKTVQRAIELQFEEGSEATEAGDSGSPVVVLLDDGDFALVGMHIGSNVEGRTAIVVPIWQILDPLTFDEVGGQLPAGSLTLVGDP